MADYILYGTEIELATINWFRNGFVSCVLFCYEWYKHFLTRFQKSLYSYTYLLLWIYAQMHHCEFILTRIYIHVYITHIYMKIPTHTHTHLCEFTIARSLAGTQICVNICNAFIFDNQKLKKSVENHYFCNRNRRKPSHILNISGAYICVWVCKYIWLCKCSFNIYQTVCVCVHTYIYIFLLRWNVGKKTNKNGDYYYFSSF